MKYIKLYVFGILCIGLLSAIYLPIYQTSAMPTSDVIALSTNPAKSFITFNNMAPGDKVSKSIQVLNDGNVDFNYSLSAIKEVGDQILFDKLSIKVSEKNIDIYEGRLKNLDKLDLGELLSHRKDELLFTVEIPSEVSNEVKRKSTSVAFIFVANGLSESKESTSNELPKTATSYFNYFLTGLSIITLGIIFILFKRRMNKKY